MITDISSLPPTRRMDKNLLQGIGRSTRPAKCKSLIENLTESDRLLTANELAVVLNLSPNTIRKWRHRQQIPFIKVNGWSIRYHLGSIQSWLANQGDQS